MIIIKDVCKKYDNKVALKDVSLEIPKESVIVFAGINGAGKTTLLKCIAGLMPFAGGITIDGNSQSSIEGKRLLAFCPEVPEIFDFLTLEEHIHYWALALNITDWEERAKILYERFNLKDYVHVMGKNMSKGVKQKTSLCCAFIKEYGYFILDEPMVGLDPFAIKELKAIILEKKRKGCTVIISTHILESVQDIWDHMFVIDNGVIVNDAKKSDGEDILELFFESQIRR